MKSLLLSILLFVFVVPLYAQPINDDCINAIQLTPSTNMNCSPTAGTTVGTLTGDYQNCMEYTIMNVWYKFTATSANHTIQLTFGTIVDATIYLYNNDCNNLSIINPCVYPTAGPVVNKVMSGLTVGQEYYISIGTREQSDEGTFTVCVLTPPAPANDECLTATVLTPALSNITTYTAGTNFLATQSLPGCSNEAVSDVWYQFTATNTKHRIVVEQLTMQGSANMEVYSGSCGSLSSINCFSAFPANNLLTALTPGSVYYIRIWSTFNPGSFNIAVTAPPINDDCINAANVIPAPAGVEACTNAITVSNIDATSGGSTCSNSNINTWYSFAATQEVHRIKVYGGNLNQRRIQVLSGNCGTFTSLACNTEIFSGDTTIVTLGGLIAGQTYFINFYSNAAGSVSTMCITSPSFPANDGCANAQTLLPAADSTITYTAGHTYNTTPQPGLTGGCNFQGFDVWYKFTATATQHVAAIKKTSATFFSTVNIEWWSGTCGTLVHQRCMFSSVDSMFGMGNMVIGDQYYLRVYSDAFEQRDSFIIGLFTPIAVSNDECETATEIIPNTDASCTMIGSTNLGATQSSNTNCGGVVIGNIKDVWLKFTATSTSHRVRLTRDGGTQLRYQIYSGSCGALTSIECAPVITSTLIGAGVDRRYDGLTIGNTYYIRVYNVNQAGGTFDVCVRTVVLPSNDNCIGAVTLTPQASVLDGDYTFGFTQDGTASTTGITCGSGQDDDIWYSFTATQSNMQVVLQNGSIQQTTIGIYTGPCNALTQIKCQASTEIRDNWVRLSNLVVNQVYYIRVYSTSTAATGQGSFSIMVTTQYVAPVNDDCAGAVTLTPSATYTPVAGTLVDAVPSSIMGCSSGIDVWYKFTATAATHSIITDGFGYVTNLSLFTGNCPTLTLMNGTCNYTYGISNYSNLVPGTLYHIKVSTNNNSNYPLSIFNIAVTAPTIPANDECVGAIALPVDNNASDAPTTVYNTALANYPSFFSCVQFQDLWYSFVAPAEPVTIEATGINLNESIELLSGGCGALTSVACNEAIGDDRHNVLNAPLLTAGQIYYVRVSAAETIDQLSFKMKIYKNESIKINTTLDTACIITNLVMNPGLEAPYFFFKTGFIGTVNPGESFIPYWNIPTRGTSDFFTAMNEPLSTADVPNNFCFGHQSARNGMGYAGLFAFFDGEYREYVQGTLSDTLEIGKQYLFSMYVSLSDFSTAAINNLGVAFVTSPVTEFQYGALNMIPQVVSTNNVILGNKQDWVNVSGVFTADQPFTRFVIGNFKNDTQTNFVPVVDTSLALSGGTASGCATLGRVAYYFLDDILVSEVDINNVLCATPLPLQLLNFQGKKELERVKLTCQTDNERNTSHFVVEKSRDAKSFAPIDSLAAKNNLTTNDYQLYDFKPFNGSNFYRLRQVGESGASVYSQTVQVDFGGQYEQLNIFPNPAKDVIHIDNASANVMEVIIYDTRGTAVKKLQYKGNHGVAVAVADLPAGLYLLQVIQDEKTTNAKFIKQ